MAAEERPIVLKGDLDSGDPRAQEPSFDAIVKSSCDRLKSTHIRYSIRRIRELEEELDRLEKELDDFLSAKAD